VCNDITRTASSRLFQDSWRQIVIILCSGKNDISLRTG